MTSTLYDIVSDDNGNDTIVYNNKNIFEYVHSAKEIEIDSTIVNDEYALMTTRVSNHTLESAENWCKSQHYIKSVYSCSKAIAKYVKQSKLLVIEMNNTTNKILGIGFIYNVLPEPYKYKINSTYFNDKYAYLCRCRISINNMNPNEIKLIQLLETFCFKGKSNLKRVRGITRFPLKLMTKLKKEDNDILLTIKNMFVNRFS